MPDPRTYPSQDVVVTLKGLQVGLAPDSEVVARRNEDSFRIDDGVRVISRDKTGSVSVTVIAGSDEERKLAGLSDAPGQLVIEHRDGRRLATGEDAYLNGFSGGPETIVYRIDVCTLNFPD